MLLTLAERKRRCKFQPSYRFRESGNWSRETIQASQSKHLNLGLRPPWQGTERVFDYECTQSDPQAVNVDTQEAFPPEIYCDPGSLSHCWLERRM